MTEQRYSAGAMRAAERIDAAIISAATLPTNAEVATIISEETGDLALIEALEGCLHSIEPLVTEETRRNSRRKKGGQPATVIHLPRYEQARAALAAARKEG